jgi:DNA-binding LacI/PurR family transcriptional regulator
MPCNPQPKRRIKYTGLVDYIRGEISAGNLRVGDRLPQFTELRARFGVTPNTVSRALGTLEADGLVLREQGRGVFVAEPKGRTATKIIGYIGSAFERSHHLAYYGNLVRGIRDTAQLAGFELLPLSKQSSLHWEKLDGLVIDDSTNHYDSIKTPVILPRVSMLVPRQDMSSVAIDDSDGARMATQHLIDLGHRRIAYLSPGSSTEYHCRMRHLGYQAALEANGIAPQQDWVRTLIPWVEETGFVGQGQSTMADWLQDDWCNLGCTALLAYNDPTAIGALEALLEAGIDVPGQWSVAGFDGVVDDSYWASRLTTVEVPLFRIGERAVKLLLQQISHETTADVHEILPMQLRPGTTSTPIS